MEYDHVTRDVTVNGDGQFDSRWDQSKCLNSISVLRFETERSRINPKATHFEGKPNLIPLPARRNSINLSPHFTLHTRRGSVNHLVHNGYLGRLLGHCRGRDAMERRRGRGPGSGFSGSTPLILCLVLTWHR